MLDSGEVASQADLARREGLSRPRVTQILNLLKLAPEIQQAILELPVGTPERLVTERKLRDVAHLQHEEQLVALRKIAPTASNGHRQKQCKMSSA